MRRIPAIAAVGMLLCGAALPQTPSRHPADDQPIRISTELVQVDAVVTDKSGRIVGDLTKNDFEVYERGKKQQLSFLEYVDVSGPRVNLPRNAQPTPANEDLTEADV